jgi:hypothetical protein
MSQAAHHRSGSMRSRFRSCPGNPQPLHRLARQDTAGGCQCLCTKLCCDKLLKHHTSKARHWNSMASDKRATYCISRTAQGHRCAALRTRTYTNITATLGCSCCGGRLNDTFPAACHSARASSAGPQLDPAAGSALPHGYQKVPQGEA